jgi:hypothetical protein
MNNIDLLVLTGTIWIAPHCPPLVGKVTGLFLLLCAVGGGLGWL